MTDEFLEAFARAIWKSHGFEDRWAEIKDVGREEWMTEARKLWELAQPKPPS